MKNLFFLFLFFLLFMTSCKKDSFEVLLLNRGINKEDSLEIKILNNTKENYLFFLNNNRLEYREISNSLEVIITENGKPLPSNFTIIDTFVIPDEETGINKIDSMEMAKYFDCSKNLVKIIPSKSYILLKFLLIDYSSRCGAGYFPNIEDEKLYKVKLKVDLDSNYISKKDMENINKVRKGKKLKFFQGQLNSNTVNLLN